MQCEAIFFEIATVAWWGKSDINIHVQQNWDTKPKIKICELYQIKTESNHCRLRPDFQAIQLLESSIRTTKPLVEKNATKNPVIEEQKSKFSPIASTVSLDIQILNLIVWLVYFFDFVVSAKVWLTYRAWGSFGGGGGGDQSLSMSWTWQPIQL